MNGDSAGELSAGRSAVAPAWGPSSTSWASLGFAVSGGSWERADVFGQERHARKQVVMAPVGWRPVGQQGPLGGWGWGQLN